jgi:hydrogenase expression/formation protein HypC
MHKFGHGPTVPLMCLGIPAQVVEVGGQGLATAEVSGVRREISTALVPETEVGDWVLVHVGFALHTIDEAEAARTLALLDEIEWFDAGEPVASDSRKRRT